jgi:hypothetical protein
MSFSRANLKAISWLYEFEKAGIVIILKLVLFQTNEQSGQK